jgi:hypothetical protein
MIRDDGRRSTRRSFHRRILNVINVKLTVKHYKRLNTVTHLIDLMSFCSIFFAIESLNRLYENFTQNTVLRR